MFKKILIANRGEIACRVMQTAQRLGISTVAVYSEADAEAMHVSMADEAVAIGPPPAQQSYLVADKIIAAAKSTGAEAVHPGYGFLSENAGFAAACANNGMVFIGPPSAAIADMGSKSAAKAIMSKAKVPVVPGYHGDNQDEKFLQQEAEKTGYPLLIKAAAGGGGKGMRLVEQAEDFSAALAAAKRESAAAFNDDKMLLEKYLVRPRHIEIQVFRDSHGNGVYLFERDCSVQRRHQKVLEEAPAPGMTKARRKAMGEAALTAAAAIDYEGAGTVEFIVSSDGEFYFMEMNTRLQVEHPVTEMITGHDLVEWQLRVAAGEPLPVKQKDLHINGHALEARIYAEDPAKGFLPCIGELSQLRFPAAASAVRVDTGVREGDSVSVYYDPLIAKLITWGADRAACLQQMQEAIANTHIGGLKNNLHFIGRMVAHPAFQKGGVDTDFIPRHSAELLPPQDAMSAAGISAVGAASGALPANASAAAPGAGSSHGVAPRSPWDMQNHWQLNLPPSEPLSIDMDSTDGDAASKQAAGAGKFIAPMPGRIIAVLVKPGQKVSKGQPLLILEAMKMEHTITADRDGKVKTIPHAENDMVQDGTELITLE